MHSPLATTSDILSSVQVTASIKDIPIKGCIEFNVDRVLTNFLPVVRQTIGIVHFCVAYNAETNNTFNLRRCKRVKTLGHVRFCHEATRYIISFDVSPVLISSLEYNPLVSALASKSISHDGGIITDERGYLVK